MERFSKKVAIVSHILPPATAGTAMRLYRLLRDIHPDDYCLLTCRDYESEGEGDSHGRLPAKHYRLPSEFLKLRLPTVFGLASFFNAITLFPRIYQRSRNITRIVKDERCNAIMAFSGDLIDLPAGYLASLKCRVPFYAEIDDYYSYQWLSFLCRCFAKVVEPIVLRGAVRVVVLNDFLRDEYQRRYHINPIVIYNPCETSTAIEGKNIPWPASHDEIAIVFTGSVYHANCSAFRNLIAAIKFLGRTDIKLHLYTAQPRESIEQSGIYDPVVFHGHLPPSKIPEVQARADILFLPLAFKSRIPEVIKTSAPFKMGEYMSSGRPILVHAPADSFLSWYFRTNQCGIVVDKNDPKFLAEEINRLISDGELKRKLTGKAIEAAVRDFSINRIQKNFRELIV